VLAGDAAGLEPALAAHQAVLEAQARHLADTLDRVRDLRTGLAQGRAPGLAELTRLVQPAGEPVVEFDLPWPWGGERFSLGELGPITWIVGPLGSGKTQLAKRLAAELPGASFVGLDRAAAAPDVSALPVGVDIAVGWLIEDGATASKALTHLLVALEVEASAIIVDMVEQGLDQPTQEALIAHLRRRGPDAVPLFLMTRSSATLDLAALGPGETILFCPANHSPPIRVWPVPGSPGYEAVATCLATPDIRARTEGVVAMRRDVVNSL